MTDKLIPAQSNLGARLGRHQFAFLRALAQGVEVEAAAMRYLGLERGRAARAAAQALSDQVRALARREGRRGWRLLGRAITPIAAPVTAPPSIDAWAAERGFDGFSLDDLLPLYLAEYPAEPADVARRRARNGRLRAAQLALLLDIERVAASAAQGCDLLTDWLDSRTAGRLRSFGFVTVDDVLREWRRGACWYRGIPGFGKAKAARVVVLLRAAVGATEAIALPRLTDLARVAGVAADGAAVDQWIAARARSPATVRAYKLEADRWRLWLAVMRGKSLRAVTVDDCTEYLNFLAAIPEEWQSRRTVRRGAAGWAPFSGDLSAAARVRACAAVSSLQAWLLRAQYVDRDAWALVRRPGGRRAGEATARAIPASAWAALTAELARHKGSEAGARTYFAVVFAGGCGVRAAELLGARFADVDRSARVWTLAVVGKGERRRCVVLTPEARAALEEYAAFRGVALSDEAAPLVGCVSDALRAPSYQSFADSVTMRTRRAIEALRLDESIARVLRRVSLHWLRHTHATQALERGIAIDLIQDQLGHADIRTTRGYGRQALENRADAFRRAFESV